MILHYFNFNFEINGVPLPSHADDEVRHGEAEEEKTEECCDGGANGDDPEGGQERERLGGEAFACGGDEGRDGISGGKSQPARLLVRAGYTTGVSSIQNCAMMGMPRPMSP